MSRITYHIIIYVILIIGAIIMFTPFVWMVSASLKSRSDVMGLPPTLFSQPLQWGNYLKVWSEINFMRYSLNSLFVAVLDLTGTLISCAMVGFGLAMFTFKGRATLFILMLATLMLPGQVTLIPTYFIWKSLGMLDSFYPLILPNFLGGAFGIFLLHQYFKTLPRELYDAAMVDGASPPYIFTRIYLPLAKPALSALAVFTFLSAWNNVLGPLIYLQTKTLRTLPLGLLFLQNEADYNVSLIMAGAVITTLPVILVFLLAQKHFVQGIASSGMKT